MQSFVSDLLGKPWKLGAMGPEEFDCFSICIYITKELLGYELMHPAYSDVKQFHNEFRCIDERDAQPLDWVHENPPERGYSDQHVVLVENELFVIECKKATGVCRRYRDTLINPVFYRLKYAEAR
jgi:hypothetical protein